MRSRRVAQGAVLHHRPGEGGPRVHVGGARCPQSLKSPELFKRGIPKRAGSLWLFGGPGNVVMSTVTTIQATREELKPHRGVWSRADWLVVGAICGVAVLLPALVSLAVGSFSLP